MMLYLGFFHVDTLAAFLRHRVFKESIFQALSRCNTPQWRKSNNFLPFALDLRETAFKIPKTKESFYL